MALKITIFDGVIPMLDTIMKANIGQGLDALDYAGSYLRDAQRRAFRNSTTVWRQFYINGKRKIFKSMALSIGRRRNNVAKSNKGRPKSMENFITSNLMVKSLTMVVGGKHKRLRPRLRRDGKVVGQAKSVGSVTKGSYAILQKLNSGELSSDYKGLVRPNSMAGFKNAKYVKGRNFIERGRASAMPKVREIMTSKLESMIHKQINRTEIKVREAKTS